jgi:very-short-patch-repair endonuclease
MCPGIDGFAKTLRKKPTDAENKLWQHLRAKRLFGLKFRRQEPIGGYIADFVCLEKKVIIELDGGQHSEKPEKDQERDEWLKAEGFRVLRFWNNDVFKQTNDILEMIAKTCMQTPSPSSPPLKGGEVWGKGSRENTSSGKLDEPRSQGTK